EDGGTRVALATAAPAAFGTRPLLRRARRSAHLWRTVLHADGACHRHLLFHLGGHRPVAVGRIRGNDLRPAVLPVVHGFGARAVAAGKPHRGRHAGRADAAKAALHRTRPAVARTHRRDADRPAHLGDAVLHDPDAAARHRLLRDRGGAVGGVAGAD